MTALFALACHDPSAPAPVEAAPPSTSASTPATPTSTASLTVEAPWSVYPSPPMVGDLDGDGRADLILELVDPQRQDRWVVVRGPLDGASIPSGAWVDWDAGWYAPRVVEATGDGQADLLVEYWPHGPVLDVPSEYWLVDGPWDGDPGPTADWVSIGPDDYGAVDVDHDGTVDRVVEVDPTDPTGHLGVTWGPRSRWGGSADVVIDPMCQGAASYGYGWWNATWPAFPGDLDGDGQPELVIRSFGEHDGLTCGGFTVSLPAAGSVDPWSSALAVSDSPFDAVALADLDGDGLPEVWDGGAVLRSPVAVTEGGLTGSGTASLDPQVDRVEPLPFDLGDDGVGDVLVRTARTVQVVSGIDGLAWVGGGWAIASGASVVPYLDDGQGWLVVATSTEPTVTLLDLGPAGP
jgi:hypothetical protein